MINLVSLLFSLVTVGFIVIRAAMLDKLLPWFKPAPHDVPSLGRSKVKVPYR